MRNLLLTLLIGLLPILGYTQDKVSTYISNYQHIAITEMNRSGIPASITLAQGMFESAYGESPSAISYNNHFGIKCKKEWVGSYFYKHDDDRDKNGKLIPSCFRAYGTVDESFQDHTDFLVERERYAELFTYHSTDYYNWAIGLERCGYATNKMYGERLVEIIERYALYQYDLPQAIVPSFVSQVDSSKPMRDVESTLVATDAFAVVYTSESLDEQKEIIIVKSKNDQIEKETLRTLTVLASFQEFSISSVVSVDTVGVQKLVVVEDKTTKVNRVNQAIILPANYRRKSDQSSLTSTNMERR